MRGQRTLEHLIEDQVKTWSVGQRSVRGGRLPYRPIITISRAFGAPGTALASEIADRTGFTLWDRELVQAIAHEAGADERVMATLDERRRRTIDDAIRSLIVGLDHTNVQYFRALVRVLRTVAIHGRAIVVGRGANYAVRADQALRVRLDAPLAWRVAHHAQKEGLSETAAKARVIEKDVERNDFVTHYFRHDVTCAVDYDLVVNAATYSVIASADLVLAAYARRFVPLEDAG